MNQEGFWVSPYNETEEVRAQLVNLPKKVKIYDTTLRDGEQTVGVSFTAEDKLRIAQALADAGVDRIEAGFPTSNEDDKRAIKNIVEQVKGPEIWGFGRCNVGDVQLNIETGVRHLVVEIATSQEKFKAWGMTEEVVLQRIRNAVNFAKKEGIYTAFFAVDASRAEERFLKQAYDVAVKECGADEIVLVDTLGVASPEAMGYLTRKVRSWVDVPIAIHCHNDFGLGVACTLAGLKEGANCAHVTVNGLGEKTGNADLATLVLALNGLYGVETNVDLKKTKELSRLVEQLSRFPVSPMAPVVGDKAFTRESGLVIAQMLTYPPSVEGYAPEVVGREREVALGKKSGKKSIEYALEKTGMHVSEDNWDALLQDVKNAGIEKHSNITPEEFIELAKKYQN